ncbi:MAG: hypothetical protein M1826_001338 [Phylliscum demangeonii]|nr:MAG: hypothetical protein M1826_001338 [Phylliscum demangeonii]
MDPNPSERPHAGGWSLDKDAIKRHSLVWQERTSRRLSFTQVTQATIRAVTPDFGLEEAVTKDISATEGPTINAPPDAKPSRNRLVKSQGSDIAYVALEHPSLEKGSRKVLVRSRTKTLDEGGQSLDRQRFDMARHRKNSDFCALVHRSNMLGSSGEENLKGAPTVSLADPTTPQQLSDPLSETTKMRPGRHLRVNTPAHAKSGNDGAIIKVGKLLYWDDSNLREPLSPSLPSSTWARRPSQPHHAWRGISAVLRENGELKLYEVADMRMIASVRLSHLSRVAIQLIHPSLLGKPYCIGICPRYAVVATAVWPARPLYVALESRVLFEAWFVLLRAFAIPELYGSDPAKRSQSMDLTREPTGTLHSTAKDVFRLERSVSVRVVEAKIRTARPRTTPEGSAAEQLSRIIREESTLPGYFAEVIMDGLVWARTMLRSQQTDLFWREDYEFVNVPRSIDGCSVLLNRELTDSSRAVSRLEHFPETYPGCMEVTTCGKVDVEFDTIGSSDGVEGWHPIVNKDQDVVGDLFLRIGVEEVVVLMLHEYSSLSAILHNFSTNLSGNIARSMPKKLYRLSTCFVDIFQATGHANAWLMSITKHEVEGKSNSLAMSGTGSASRSGSYGSADGATERDQIVSEAARAAVAEVNLLFRANSLLTRSLDVHMRRLGKEYLDSTLADLLTEINSNDADCEVDPSRIGPGGYLAGNWRNLVKQFRRVWSAIYQSTTRCPRDMRLLLQYIRGCCEERFGDYHHTVRYSSVSGFLFLRFFCPAILNPKLFGLLPDHPRPQAQRTLTLIAKTLQGLANMASFGLKESWMEPMNNHLVVHRGEFREFIDWICSVPSDQVPSPAAPVSYTTPMNIFARLPPSHREGYPSLPYLIDEARVYASLVELWMGAQPDANSLHAAGGDDLLKFHDLCRSLQHRAAQCVAKATTQPTSHPSAPPLPPTASSSSIPPLSPLIGIGSIGHVQSFASADGGSGGGSGESTVDPSTAVSRPQHDRSRIKQSIGSAVAEGKGTKNGVTTMEEARGPPHEDKDEEADDHDQPWSQPPFAAAREGSAKQKLSNLVIGLRRHKGK